METDGDSNNVLSSPTPPVYQSLSPFLSHLRSKFEPRLTTVPDRTLRNQSVHGWWDFHHTSGNRYLDGVSTG